MDGLARHFVLREAIHSTAMEHSNDCDCTVCRAADGDHEALAEIYRSLPKWDQERTEE